MNDLTPSTVDLPGGAIEIRDSGGDGPLVVFVHGVLVDGRLWDNVWPAVAAAGFRCVMPNLPIGGHRLPLEPGADRTPRGQADRIAALIRALGAERAVIVGNDSGGAISQILAAEDPDVVDRLILTSSDAFQHFPPLLFRPLTLVARSPKLLRATLWTLSRRPVRRMPFAFGLLSKKPIPDDLFEDWFNAPLSNPDILRDIAGMVRAISPDQTIDAAEKLRGFPRPALMAWAENDKFFPISDGEKLASMMPRASLVPIPDSYTFSQFDQPEATSDAIVGFLKETGPA